MTEEEKRLTREDVLKLIEEHGGPKGLDLSGKNLELIDLSNLNLSGVIFDKANLMGANLQLSNLQEQASLQGTNLSGANLELASLLYANIKEANLGKAKLRGASLYNAQLQKADLWAADLTYTDLKEADLEGVNLRGAELVNTYISGANLSNAYLNGADLSKVSDLAGIKWGKKYMVGEEIEGHLAVASGVYCNLKKWYTDAGMYTIADRFHYREWAATRKKLRWREHPWQKLWNWVFCLSCGYGDKPERVVFWAAVVVFGMAAVYSVGALSFPSALYYSASSFTALGYGLWVSVPEGWVKGLGAFEAFIGVFMMALFLITFVRKMTR